MGTQSQDTASDRQQRGSVQADRTKTGTGIGRKKRAVFVLLGSVLLVRGFKLRSLRGILIALGGGWLLTRGLRSQPALEGMGDQLTGSTKASRSIIIGNPPDELYDAWRDPDTLSRIMGHFAEVTPVDEDRFKWTVRGPFDREISWETRVVAEEPGAFLRWETSTDTLLPHEGSVSFRPAPGNRGTKVSLSIKFDPPGGALGSSTLNRLGILPTTLEGTVLHRFKTLIESGEIPTLEGNPSARGKGDLL